MSTDQQTRIVENTNPELIFLKRKEVEERCRVSRSFIYTNMEKGLFPVPVRYGAKAVRWRLSDIVAWEKSRQPSERYRSRTLRQELAQ